MEADLWIRCHGVDLRDLWRPGGRLTWRLLGNLIRHLPPESATMTALRNAQPDDPASGGDPTQAPWSQTEILLATAVDELRYARHNYTVTHLAKGKRKPKSPDPIPRPGLQPQKGQRKKLNDGHYDVLYRHINGLPQDPGVRFELIKGGGEG